MSEEMKSCPACKSPYGYSMGNEMYACPECGNEWNPNEEKEEETSNVDTLKVKDSNGNELEDGDDVIVIKDLKVKGSSAVVKRNRDCQKCQCAFYSIFPCHCCTDVRYCRPTHRHSMRFILGQLVDRCSKTMHYIVLILVTGRNNDGRVRRN